MKSLFSAILTAFAALWCLSSCDRVAVTAQSVAFDSLCVDTVCPLFKNYNKPACHLVMHMAVPAATTDEMLRQPIEHFIALLPKDGAFDDEESSSSVQAMVDAYVRAYLTQYLNEGPDAIDSYGEDMDAAATWMSYEETVDGTVLYDADGLLSYQVRIFSYTGGAHGNYKTNNGVFCLETRTQVALEDLFADVSLADVNAMLRQRLATQYECESVAQLQEKGLFFSPADIEATDNFYVNAEGICWMFDPYDIAPYSTGEVSVTLQWDELYPLLLPDSPVLKLAQKL